MNRSLTIASFVTGVLLLTALSLSAAVPQLISYQGYLTDAVGSPVADGPYLIKFIIWDDPVAVAAPNEKWNSGFQSVTVTDGLFNYDLGSNTPYLPDDLFTDTVCWLGITVGVDPEITPRIMLTSKGYAYHALRADSAGTLGGQLPSYYLAWANLTGVPGGFADGTDDVDTDWNNLTGVPAGFADNIDDVGTGDITGVTAGTGMTGGGTSGTVTLHADASYLQRRVNGVAPGGTAIKTINADGTVAVVAIPQGDITGVTAGSGMAGGGTSGTVTLNVATGGITSSHVLDGTVALADLSFTPGDITAVNAGTALTGGGTAGSVTLNVASTISSDHTFEGDIQFGDSTMRVNNTGARFGSNFSPSAIYVLQASRYLNTTSSRTGIYSNLDNGLTGTMYGLRASVGFTGDAGGTRYGVYSNVDMLHTSVSSQYGVYAVAGSSSKTAGTSYGVRAYGYAGTGSVGYGIYASEVGSGTNYAGYFSGNVHVAGTFSKSGGAFKIDHPLDPMNMYLQHSFVESPDMMNIYNGNVTLDANGESIVTMPDYFNAINTDFRYQLTAVGAPGPNLYIAEKINGNQFRIAGGESFSEVSWQVTGIRNDKYAQAHRIQVEVDKPSHEIGTFLNPEELGQPIERHVHWEQIKEARDNDKDQEERVLTTDN